MASEVNQGESSKTFEGATDLTCPEFVAKNRNKVYLLQDQQGRHLIRKYYKISPYGSLSELEMYELMQGGGDQGESKKIADRLGISLSEGQKAFWQKYTARLYEPPDLPQGQLHTNQETDNSTEQHTIHLENLFAEVQDLCFMDIKLGWNNYGANDPEREAFKRDKNLMRRKLGFSLDALVLNSYHGVTMKKAEFVDMDLVQLSQYFGKYLGQAGEHTDKLLKEILEDLNTIKETLHDSENKFRLYGTSIIIQFDKSQLDSELKSYRMTLIDFEHVVVVDPKDLEGDQNVVFGLERLIEGFTEAGKGAAGQDN